LAKGGLMRLILHIGTPKAGSSSLQVALGANRAFLAERGVLYPALGRATHHSDLAAGLHHPDSMREIDLRRNGNDPQAVVRNTQDAWQSVADQVAKHKPETLILSAENFMSIDDFDMMSKWLARIAPNASLTSIAYLRAPVPNHESKLSQRLGRTWEIRLPGSLPWHARLLRWKKLGQVQLRDLAAVGDLRTDFIETVQQGFASTISLPDRNANVSLTGEGCIALQAVMMNGRDSDGAQNAQRSRAWRMRLARAEATLGDTLSLRRVSVNPAVRWLILDAWHEEALALRRDFGFSFREPVLYDRDAIDRGLLETGAREHGYSETDPLARFLDNDPVAAVQLLAHAAEDTETSLLAAGTNGLKNRLRRIVRRGSI
jgi:hypothetical protein